MAVSRKRGGAKQHRKRVMKRNQLISLLQKKLQKHIEALQNKQQHDLQESV